MKDIRDNARELMKGFCRVCSVCNGKACVGEVPGMGGVNTASSFHNNVSALSGIRLNMRLVHDVVEPETSISLLGMPLAMPVLAAPIGGVSFNMGGGISEEEYVDAVLGGCREHNIMGCTGDGVPSFIMDAGMGGIATVGGNGIPFIKPWDGEEFDCKLERVLASECPAVGMDIDAAGLVTLRKMGRPVSPKNVVALAKVAERVHLAGRAFILKGVMTVEDALCAVQAGVDAIVVSNHGGRVLDHTPGGAEVLPEIADAVRRKVTILADGGVRDGFDVIKMLALGADAVLIGRPFAIAAVGGKAAGVGTYVETIRTQLVQAMVLTGCASLQDVGRHILRSI